MMMTHSYRTRQNWAACALTAVACLHSTHADQPFYNIIELGADDKTQLSATDLNDRGQVTGTINGDRAFVWANGQLIVHDSNDRSFGTGLNETGSVIGSIRLGTSNFAMQWRPLVPSTDVLKIPESADPVAINNTGLIVGRETDDRQAWVFNTTTQRFLFLNFNGTPTPPGINEAVAVTDSGDVYGTMSRDDFQPQGFMWNEINGVTRLEQPPGNFAAVHGANDHGDAVGFGMDIDFTQHVALWQDGVYTDLGVSDPRRFFISDAHDVNNDQHIVGSSPNDFEQRTYGWIWIDGIYYDLNDLVRPRANIDFARGVKINNTGEILAQTFDPTMGGRTVRPVLMRPSTLTLSNPIPGIAGEVNTLLIEGARPKSTVYLAYGRGQGLTNVPTCGGLTVDILQASLLTSIKTDGSGKAALQRFVPDGLAGRVILFQIVEPSTCTASPLVEHRFE